MKPIRYLAVVTMGLAIATGALAAGETPPGSATEAQGDMQKFGTPVTEKKSLALAKLEKKPARYAGRKVKVEGTVRDVCQGRGCWIEIESSDGATFMAKSLDETVLVPKDIKGWQVVVQGVVTPLTSKGHDHADAEMEEGHSCPVPSYVVATQGVEIRKAVPPKK